MVELDARARLLRAALAFLSLEPREPELRLLDNCFDTWRGIGDIVAGSRWPSSQPVPPLQHNAPPMARNMRGSHGMSVGFMITAFVFALVLSCAVACVDWWREARLMTPRLRMAAPLKSTVKPVSPATEQRAA